MAEIGKDAQPHARNPIKPHASPQLLLLGANEGQLRLLAKLFSQDVYTSFIARNQRVAWHMLTTQRIDLILLDIDYPLEEDYQFCVRLRQRSHVPLIILACAVSTDTRIAWFEVGADACLSKPLPIQVLRAHMRAILRRINYPPRPARQ